MEKVLAFVKKNAVLCIAFTLAVFSAFLVPPDAGYLEYYDFKTLSCLLGTLAVICALKNIRFFSILAQRILVFAGNARTAAVMLVYITFIGSMLIANDMALITFLPLGYYVFSFIGNTKELATVFILQNIAANLGGMLTPFGNPQNLYLYTHFSIPTGEFMGIMVMPFVVSIVLITACCLLIKDRKIQLSHSDNDKLRLPPVRTTAYLALFALTILMVFRTLPYYYVLPFVLVCVFLMDRNALTKVDYGLLMTFVCFFTFSGNLSRLEPVRAFFSNLLQKNTLLTSVLSCQVISNVPSAILLSRFTDNYPALLIGVNIGGTGTLIASLASLITFREFTAYYPEDTGMYMARFSIFNFGFLALHVVLSLFAYRI